MSPIDRECTNLYLHFIVTSALHRTVSELF